MQKRRAWCRACGTEGDYPTGWAIMNVSDFETFRKAVQTPIGGADGPEPGTRVVRLRLRHLRCVKCNGRALVAGGRPRVLVPNAVPARG